MGVCLRGGGRLRGRIDPQEDFAQGSVSEASEEEGI